MIVCKPLRLSVMIKNYYEEIVGTRTVQQYNN